MMLLGAQLFQIIHVLGKPLVLREPDMNLNQQAHGRATEGPLQPALSGATHSSYILIIRDPMNSLTNRPEMVS